MLLKPFQTTFDPGRPGRAGQAYTKVCPPPDVGGGGSAGGGSRPVPGTRCYVVYVYGPPSPYDGGPTILRYYTVCV